MFFLLFCSFSNPLPRAKATCVQDLFWSNADVQISTVLKAALQWQGTGRSITSALLPSNSIPSALESRPVSVLLMTLAWISCMHVMPTFCLACLACWPGLPPALSLLMSLLVWVVIPGLGQPSFSLQLQAGWDQTTLWEELSFWLPILCPLRGSSSLIFPNMKITGYVFSYLDHGKYSCLSDAQKIICLISAIHITRYWPIGSKCTSPHCRQYLIINVNEP